jgi:signal transduction histidine kinase/ActR/RegA family two-component response regulator
MGGVGRVRQLEAENRRLKRRLRSLERLISARPALERTLGNMKGPGGERRDQYLRRQAVLLRKSLAIISEQTVPGLLQRVADAARRLTRARLGVAGHGYTDGRFVVAAAQGGASSQSCALDRECKIARGGVYMTLLAASGAVRLTDAELKCHPDWWGLPEGHVPLRGLLGIALRDAQDRPIGLIMVSDRQQGDFTPADEAWLRQLGVVASLALWHLDVRQQAEAANAAKDRFLADLAHELRTPLTPVLWTVTLLAADRRLDDQQREDLEVARRNIGLATRLIDDLLDVARIARGKVCLKRRAVDIRLILRQAANVCRSDLEQRRLALTLDLPEEGCWVDGDESRLEQVFWNLLKNAAKFTPCEGHIRLRCQADGDQIVAEVCDDGIGIEPHLLPRLFDAFEQGDAAHDSKFGGLGLGLTISKGLVELHGGAISGHSAGRGRGATFTVRLPIVLPQTATPEPAAVPATEMSADEANAQPPAGNPRILLVEDHLDTARLMARLLRSRGYEVYTAGTIAEANQQFSQRTFDLLISGLGLPDGSGLDLMSALRAHGCDVRGIALTGYGQDQDIYRTRQAGFSTHLTKPIDARKLEAAIIAVTGPARQKSGA